MQDVQCTSMFTEEERRELEITFSTYSYGKINLKKTPKSKKKL